LGGWTHQPKSAVTVPTDRPTVVLVMFEWGGEYPLWDRSPHGFGPVRPEMLGISPGLAERLRSWNDEHDAAPDGPENFAWASPRARGEWHRRGLDLAHELQNELGGDVEVRYFDDGDERAVRERRGG